MSRQLRLDEFYLAPPSKVFRAWVDPARVKRWFGCGPDQLWKVHEWDSRPGGRLEVSMMMDGKAFTVKGEFIEVLPPDRLVYLFGTERVEVAFSPEGEGTRLRLCHSAIPDSRSVDIRNGGWDFCLRTSLRGFLKRRD